MNSILPTKKDKMDAAMEKIGYTFANPDILWEALQMPGASATIRNEQISFEGHKPLASIGDAVLTLALKIDCHEGKFTVGLMQCHVSDVASNERLALVGELANLDQIVCKNQSQGGAVSKRGLATTVEALIGAAYQDGGMTAAQQVIRALHVVE